MSKKVEDCNLKGIYGLFDKVLQEFVQIVMLDKDTSVPYFQNFANDVCNPYFRKMSDLAIYIIGDTDTISGLVNSDKVYFGEMVDYTDKSTRDLQIITQTLNFIPNGYFKMPKEMQEGINEQIKSAVRDYVENYLSDDTKMAINEVLKK